MRSYHLLAGLALLFSPVAALAQVCNLKVVTDASPDYSDLPSMVHSITSKWSTPEEKCWAVFYWNHIARRQTNPMYLHGMALTDPIRQFNDYGFTMCSTISGVNQSIWEQMGLKHQYWDISNHTVCQVFYDGGWHMYDNSLSALYTLCDGKTLAAVPDIGKTLACEASGGKAEPGHIAKYHCLTATSPNGFLSGADTIRSLDEEYRCFNPNGLKYRTYFYDWDYGHRYILNIRPGETYTRYYHSLGNAPEYYVPNNNGKDPESANPRYRIRGNGVWTFTPALTDQAAALAAARSMNNVVATPQGLRSADGSAAGATWRIESANVIASQRIRAKATSSSPQDRITISISTTNGLHWSEPRSFSDVLDLSLIKEVSGAYECLMRIGLAGSATLTDLSITTTTQVNSKTQPRLNLGKNTIHVGAGDQSDSIVYWPELHNGEYKKLIVDEKNIASTKEHPGYIGTLYPAKAKEDAYVVYRIDAPRDITRLTYGGRFYNRAPRSHIDIFHSLDGQNWTRSWSLTDTSQPWDVIHYEAIDVPAGHRSMWIKYLMNSPESAHTACSIYAVRMEANHLPLSPGFKPIEVTYTWKEVQKDRSLVERSHTQVIDKVPFTYAINTGGEDHPIMESLAISGTPTGKSGYSDGRDAGGSRWTGRWVTYGKNLAVGKKYTLSHPSKTSWEAGDPEGKKLTDGVAGPTEAGGISYRSGAIWDPRTNPTITLDLEKPTDCASFGLNFHGYPGWDALKGEIKDKVEVLVSDDSQSWRSVGFLETDWRWKDLPVNYMWPDEEKVSGATFRFIPPAPISARFVQYKVTSERNFCATELEVLDSIRFDPYDLRIALPGR